MDNKDKYELLADAQIGLPSTMGILPNDISFSLNTEGMKAVLSRATDFKLISIEEGKEEIAHNKNYAFAQVEYMGDVYDIGLYIFATEGLDVQDFAFGNKVDESALNAATEQKHYLETSMHFGSDSLRSFHLQLKIMNCLVPDASLIIDFSSLRLLSAEWLKMTAKSSIPPSPDYLYIVHAVYDEKEDGKTHYWLHTHGLYRCKIVELEMLGISEGSQEMHTLLNMTAKKFLHEMTQEKETFTIGYDGMGINLTWLRWEEAITDFPEKILGGMDDRKDETGNLTVHGEASGVLFAVEEGNMMSPQIYSKTLVDNPLYYISNEETLRMSNLAKERFSMYKEIYNRYAPKPEKKSFFSKLFASSKKKEEDVPWAFIAKLGLATDTSEDGTDLEHLWFDVLNITDDNQIEAKLINQPYWIDGLNEGDINTYPLELLTDWIIYSPETSYDTDTIYQLGFL